MLVLAAALLPHLCAVLAAFTPTRSQATLADQDDYVKHPQQQPLDSEELKELEELIGNVPKQRATGGAAEHHGARSRRDDRVRLDIWRVGRDGCRGGGHCRPEASGEHDE